jgi:hypothetical protein
MYIRYSQSRIDFGNTPLLVHVYTVYPKSIQGKSTLGHVLYHYYGRLVGQPLLWLQLLADYYSTVFHANFFDVFLMFTHRHHYTNQRTPLWSKARRFSPPLRWILTFDTRGTRIAWAPRSLTFIRILFAPTNTHCKSFPFQPVSFPIRRRRTSTSNLHVQFIRFKYTRRSYEQKNTTGFSLNAGRYHSTTERWPLSS